MMTHEINLRALRKAWDELKPSKQKALFDSMSKKEQALLATSWEFLARPSQLSPESWGDAHNYWLIISGRGFGKTRTGAETVLDHIEAVGKDARVALVGPTAADVRDTMIEGESGLMACARRRGISCSYEPSKRRISFASGAIATAFSAEIPDRLRGPQHTFAWCDELSSWEYDRDTWDMLQFGLRLGPHPKTVITTTPKPRALMKELITDKKSYVTRGSTYENEKNLSPQFIEAIKKKYEGTRLGRQELFGELLEDCPDALWQPAMLEEAQIRFEDHLTERDIARELDLIRIVVAVDPAVTSGEKSDESGILVVGKNDRDQFFVLADHTGRYTPDEWGRIVSDLYHKWVADRVVAEVNQGGDMVEHVLRTVDRNISFRGVRATKGKRVRAEPIAALYEQKKVKHVAYMPALEEQMCMFTPDGYDGSPDRVDALVWGLTELSEKQGGNLWFL